MSRNLTATGYDESSGLSRLLPLLGGLIVALVWFSLWWDARSVRGVISVSLQDVPWWAEISHLGAATLPVIGLVGLALGLILVLRRQNRIYAELKLRDVELKECRERLRRHVADLERVSDVAAHDLQEPLRRMVAYAQLLEHHDRGSLDEDAKIYVSYVVDAARRMKALISGLRAFVSVDTMPVSSDLCSGSAAVMVARQRLTDTLAARNAALVVDPLPRVAADAGAVAEIFVQLIDNAIRFQGDEQRPVVHVSAKRDGAMAVFMVRDNGIGIEPGQVARMFEIFYRPHASQMAAGIGMGLAVVRRLVTGSGGEVWVESQVGKGSTFFFSLPLAAARTQSHSITDREANAA